MLNFDKNKTCCTRKSRHRVYFSRLVQLFFEKQERCDNIRYKVTAKIPILPRENAEKFPISYLKNTEFFLKTLYVLDFITFA